MAIGTWTLTGKYLNRDQVPASGVVQIDGIPQILIDSAGNKLHAGPKRVTLDTAGMFTIALVTDSATGVESTTCGYSVTVKLNHQTIPAVTFWAPGAGATLDMADITPQTVVPVIPEAESTAGAQAKVDALAATLSATYLPLSKAPIRAVGNRFRTLTILVYHAVNLGTFQSDLNWYQEWNYTTVTFDEVWAHQQGTGTLPDKPLLITFDDGYNSQNAAAQELNTRGMKGTFFITTGWIDGTITGASFGATDTVATWAQIQQWKAWGHEIQSHSMAHQDQTSLTGAQVASEFTGSKARIETQVPSQTVWHMAYPYGAWNPTVRAALLGAGCRLARAVRIASDGAYPGANQGRYAIATTLHDAFALPAAGTGMGDIQQPNYFRTLSADPECCADFGFEAGAKGWTLGSGFASATDQFHSGTKSLKVTQSASTVSSRPARTIPVGAWCRLRISGWILSTLPSGNYAKVQLQTLKFDGTVNGANIDIGTVTGPAGWTQFSYEYVGNAADREALLFLVAQGNAAFSGAAWFDDISFKRETLASPFSTGF